MRISSVVLSFVLLVASLAYGYTGSTAPQRLAPTGDKFVCTPIWVHDGDTFTCADRTRIRVAGINAREIVWDGMRNSDGGCNNNAPCPPVDAVTARNRLVALLGTPTGVDTNGNMRVAGRAVTCSANGTSYNRVAAFCTTSSGLDISCAMTASGAGVRWERYWLGHHC